MSAEFMVGPVGCRVLADGAVSYEPELIYAGLSPGQAAEVTPLLAADGALLVPYHPVLVRTGAGLALVDTGAGPGMGDAAGRLGEALAAAGVTADDITLVLISHAHPDHVGGLARPDGRLAFPRARHVMSRAEFGYWTSGRVPADWAGEAELARQQLLPVDRAGMLDLVDGEQEVAPGIGVIPAPGHTPGHVAFWRWPGPRSAGRVISRWR
jgi:glyoxylase-like metal-dependent hydrolase (beta-lactamase superfamily II)